MRTLLVMACFLQGIFAYGETHTARPSFSYRIARAHELKPHRRTIPMKGVGAGFNQLHLKLIVSPTGDVIKADADGSAEDLKLWPSLQTEVSQWHFTPFEQGGHAVQAEIEEYIDLVPPERLPTTHVAPPELKPDSDVKIALERTGCFGTCPSYTVALSIKGIKFDGGGFVVASGQHTASVDADVVRELAKRFLAADFYSMDAIYRANVTDNPTYVVSISIDGHSKSVRDYVGSWVGMPAIVTELEDAVDTVADTQRWISGSRGLVQVLQAEKTNFQSIEAQTMLKHAAARG